MLGSQGGHRLLHFSSFCTRGQLGPGREGTVDAERGHQPRGWQSTPSAGERGCWGPLCSRPIQSPSPTSPVHPPADRCSSCPSVYTSQAIASVQSWLGCRGPFYSSPERGGSPRSVQDRALAQVMDPRCHPGRLRSRFLAPWPLSCHSPHSSDTGAAMRLQPLISPPGGQAPAESEAPGSRHPSSL